MMTTKKEKFVYPFTFDFNEEIWSKSKQKGIKFYALKFPEEWRKLVNDNFEKYKVPYKSLNALVALFQPEIVFTSSPLSSSLPWIVSREKFDLRELKKIFSSWFFQRHPREENVNSATMTWEEYDAKNNPFQNIPSLISLIVEGKLINVKAKEKEATTTTEREIKFYRVLNLEGTRRQELVSWPPYYRKKENKQQAYSYVIAFTVETDPNNKQSLLYFVSIRRWGNRKIGNKLYLQGLDKGKKRSVAAIPESIGEEPGPVIEIKIKYDRKRDKIVWEDDIDKLAATIEHMDVVIPSVEEAIAPINSNEKIKGLKFGLVDTTQDTYLRDKVKLGIFIKERESIFNSLSKILSDYGISPSLPMWTTETIKTENPFPKSYITDVGKSEKTFEEYLQNNQDYSEITKFVENLRIILLLPHNERTKDNSDLIYQYGKKLLGKSHTYLTKIKLEDAIFNGWIMGPKKEKQFREQLQELIKSIHKNETTIVLYGIRGVDYYKNDKSARDPRQDIRSIILRSGGIPKQINFELSGKSKEEEDVNVGKIINTYLDCFRMLGYPRAGFIGYKLETKTLSTLAFTLYKPKGNGWRNSNFCLISVHIDSHGKIRGSVNDSEMMSLPQLYLHISEQGQEILKPINITSSVYRRIVEIHEASENLFVYLEIQHFRKSSHIFSLSNSNRKKQVLWFDKEGKYTLGPKNIGLRIFRINNTGEIPLVFGTDTTNPPGHKSGIASKVKLDHTPDFVYSIGKRSDTFRSSKGTVKSLDPEKAAWNPGPIEILACFIQEEDNFMKFAQFIHKSRLIPPVSDTEVKNPFCLYLAKKIKEEMKDLINIPEEDTDEGPHQSNLYSFFQ